MKTQRLFGTARKPRIERRTLRTEPLESREMLAADLLYAGAALGAANQGDTSQGEPDCVQAATFSGHNQADPQIAKGGRGSRGPQNTRQSPRDARPVQNDLSDLEIEDLMHMREEEKLAHDVYEKLDATWNVLVFGNIAEAESRHMASVGNLIEKYGLEDPVGENGPGEFTNPIFSDLYADLVAQGSESLMSAYQVGALIEELDIADLKDAVDQTTHDDVQQVYENLMRGSRNHLRAFAAQIEAAGGSYDAQVLSQAEFDAIADSPRETGKGHGGQRDPQGERQQGRIDGNQGDANRSQRIANRTGNRAAEHRSSRDTRKRKMDRAGDSARVRLRDASQRMRQEAQSQQDRLREQLFANLDLRGRSHRF